VGTHDSVGFGNGEQDPRYTVTHRTFVDILYKDYCDGDPDNGKEENVIPCIFSLETIFNRFTYKVNQVFNDYG
jgi:hypothetical protein